MNGRRRWILAAAGIAWTGGAAGAAWLIVRHPPLVVSLGGYPLFLTDPWAVAGAWAFGLATLATAAAAGPRLRGRLLLTTVVGAATLSAAALLPAVRQRGPRTSPPAEPPARSERTTLLVGVDGMSWTAILPLVRRGELPTIERLMAEGSYGVLRSLRSHRETTDEWGYWSPVVWTSIATGLPPDRHGIVDFTIREAGDQRRDAASYHRRAPAFWNLFSAFDRRVAVVGWWATWPAEPVSGYMVSSHVGLRGVWSSRAAHPRHTFPPGLVQELGVTGLDQDELRRWASASIYPFESFPLIGPEELQTTYSVLSQDRLYENLALELIHRAPDLDLYAVYFEGIDALSHPFWAAMEGAGAEVPSSFPASFERHREIVPRYYRIVDGYIGRLLAALPESTTVLVVSDHGFRLEPESATGADHSPYGVLVARGPGIAKDRALSFGLRGALREAVHGPTDVLDVLPTLLYLHGLPVADDLPGSVLMALLTRAELDRRPVVRVQSFGAAGEEGEVEPEEDPEASEEYERRLEALGYVQ